MRSCPIALIGWVTVSFSLVLLWMGAYQRAEDVHGAIASAMVASVQSYQYSMSFGAARDGRLPDGMRPEHAEVMSKVRLLKRDLAALEDQLDADRLSFFRAPLETVAAAAQIGRVPQDVMRPWLGGYGTEPLRELTVRQLSLCITICEKPNLPAVTRGETLVSLNEVVMRQILPRLTKMHKAAGQWENRTLTGTRVSMAIAFIAVVGAILFTRFSVVGPLLNRVDQANAELAVRNAALEERVVARTADLTRALADVKFAHEMRTRFLASVNHEMRTPMNGVLGVAALLGRTDLTAEQRRYLETITQSGKTLVRLIDDVLDTVASSSGRMDLRYVPTNLGALLGDALDLLRPMAEARDLVLRADLRGAGTERVAVDPDRFVQVVNNLVGNAIKFTPRGTVEVVLRQSVQGDLVQTELVVRDSGPGIPEAERERLFEPFERGQREQANGTGLGLAVTKALVQQMNGRITVGEALTGGAEFVVKLPLALVSREERFEQTDAA